MAENTIHVQGKSIPVDVIEVILSKLPVKSLIRFQLLSKSCRAIISDPFFSKINYNHLPKSHNLFLREIEEQRFSLVRLGGASVLQTEAELGAPFGPAVPLSSCNGIVLLVPWNHKPCDEFVLWNPCIRRYTMIPIPFPDMNWMNAGLYHDSRTDDYKIAVILEKRSMVYSCKTRTWSEEELIPCSLSTVEEGVLLDGRLYRQKEPDYEEILCFDFRERKTARLTLPDDLGGKTAGHLRLLRLTTWSGHLCLFRIHQTRPTKWVRENHGWRDRLTNVVKTVRIRENDGWRKLTRMEKAGVHFCHTRIRVWLHSTVAVDTVSVRYSSGFVKYNNFDKRFKEIEIPGLRCSELLPYSESLLFPFDF